MLYLEGKGKSEGYISNIQRRLTILSRHANLENPQEVELAIARYKLINQVTKKQTNNPASKAYKGKLCDAYQAWCKFYKTVWEKPNYIAEERSIQPPTDERCLMLIHSARNELSLKIEISTQTGLRPCEIQGFKGLKVKDIHTDQKTITALSAKKCNARPAMPISEELTTRLKTYITRKNLNQNDLLFTGKPARYSEHFRRFKIKLAKRTCEPSITSIRLYDLRHAYVTKQLRRTQNAEIVRQIVGHKKLNTTQKYMHLLANTNGEWLVESTTDQKRADELLKQDFTYILTTPDGYMKFRKAK